MPKPEKVKRCIRKVKKTGKGKYNPYAVCWASYKGTTKRKKRK